jgi:hypothetical protein
VVLGHQTVRIFAPRCTARPCRGGSTS